MEVIRCKLFMLSKPTKKHWYFFLFLIGAFLRMAIPDFFTYIKNKNNDLESDSNNVDNLNTNLTRKYFEIIRNILSDLLFGIFHWIHKIRNKDDSKKRNQQTYNTNSQKVYFIFNGESNRDKQLYKIIIIISLVDIICQLIIPSYYIFEIKALKKENNIEIQPYELYFLLFFDIFARYLFSLWILRTYFYFHHYLSFILNIIGLIPISYAEIVFKLKLESTYILFVIIVSIQLILYSFEDIMNKVAFRTLYILPNTLIFYKGLVQLIYLAIISGFFFGFGLFKHANVNILFEFEYFIFFIPFNILRTYYLVEVIDKFSAQHMTILKVFEYNILFGYDLLIKPFFSLEGNNTNKNTNLYWYILEIFGFFLLLISSLIYNELIIINHPKLKSKTEYYLDKDADKEQCSSFYSDTIFSDSKESDNTITNLYDDLTGSDIS